VYAKHGNCFCAIAVFFTTIGTSACVINVKYRTMFVVSTEMRCHCMYILNGIAYAHNDADIIEVHQVKPLDDMMLLLTFTTGEKRLYDGSKLLQYPAFKPLADKKVFVTAKVEHGVVTWCNGEIDIAPETMYRDSYEYAI